VTVAKQSQRRIPISRPSFADVEFDAIVEPLRTGWVVQGPHVAEFERGFGAYVAADAALATTSCTTALHVAMAALDVGPGDEVIVPAFTWIATANAVEYVGGTPVFCDIDPLTMNIDVTQVEGLITDRTVGILPVHLFGLPADLETVMRIADAHGLWFVEDAACGLGAFVGDRHVGTFGRLGCFSFHPRKSITTGEGGMVVTDDRELADVVRALRDHGATPTPPGQAPDPARLGDFTRLGFNYRMTDFQGALGVAQLSRLEWILAERRRCALTYDRLLADVGWLTRPADPVNGRHGYQSYVCWYRIEERGLERLSNANEDRNRLMLRLQEAGIATRPGTHAPPFADYYQSKYGYRDSDFPIALAAEQLTIALPLYPDLSDDDIAYVVDVLTQ
jgi:perosamine synthetase